MIELAKQDWCEEDGNYWGRIFIIKLFGLMVTVFAGRRK